MGCHCLQYTFAPSIDQWHHDSPAVCPWHPAITCVAIHASDPRSHFSTRQSSASHGKGFTRLFRTVTTLPWPTRSPDLSPIQHIWDHSGWRVGHPTCMNELEARWQRHLKSETPYDLPQNWDGIEPNRPVTCMVLKATANDRRKCSRLLR
ncbi:uncharacterized protein TNCV_2383451 [Trichonephila clavipes]|nr:uncharacterized protein TNCV_2383451 [Trichonephila clavipes]